MGGLRTPPKSHSVYHVYGMSGALKPEESFWTSTAISKIDGYISSWVEWVKSDQRSWLSDRGFLFRIKDNTKILTIRNDNQALEIYHKYLGPEIPTDLDKTEVRYFVFKHFPWNLVASVYDGMRYYPDFSEDNMPLIMRGWDCESTVWFSMLNLELIDEVKIT
jgi:hypothetical protein